MKKKIFPLFLALAIAFIPFESTFAYTGGLLNGKIVTRGSDIDVTTATTGLVTDNNETSMYTLTATGTSGDTFWYKFSYPATITDYKALVSNSAGLQMKFYRADKTSIAQIGVANNTKTSMTIAAGSDLTNVTYVSMYNTTGSTINIYEIDVYGSGGTPPVKTDVTGVNITGITSNSASVTWNSPTGYSGVTYTGANVYVDGVLKTTLSPATTTYNLSGLSAGASYNVKVTAMYSDSSETTGSTQSFTTLLIKTDVTGVSIDAITFDSSLIHWTNPTGYIGVTYNGARIYVNNALIFTSSPTQTSYTLTGLSTNTTYDIEVKAFYSDGSETVGITQTLTTKLGAMDSNIVSTSIKGGGISILYTPSMTEDGNFHEVTVDGTIQELTTNIGNITITDFRSTGQGWDVTVQATPFTEVGGVGYTFPNNSLTLEGINSSSQTLASIESNATVIDSGSPVQIASANTNQGMGKTELTFFNNGLKLFVDTKNKLVDPNNLTGPNSSTPYKSVITWAVSTGP